MNANESIEFRKALQENAVDYGVTLGASELEALVAYFELLNSWNSPLHLVAPVSPREFARRHVLESLLMAEHLEQGARVADIGSGGGLPIVPCLIIRPDLQTFLIESSKKKAIFLREALKLVDASRHSVIAERFQGIPAPQVGFVSCRAVERFESLIEQLVQWAPRHATFIFFGSPALPDAMTKANLEFTPTLIPNSEKRYLFVGRRVKP